MLQCCRHETRVANTALDTDGIQRCENGLNHKRSWTRKKQSGGRNKTRQPRRRPRKRRWISELVGPNMGELVAYFTYYWITT